MKSSVIFDFDGVIADTRDLLFELFKQHAPTITNEDFDAHFDGNVYETPRIRFTRDALQQMHDDYCDRLSEDLVRPAIGPIRHLGTDYQMFIVSSGDERGIRAVLQSVGILRHFEAIYGHNTHRSKVTKFKMLEDGFGISLAESVFVTDTLGDLREAQKVGLKTIAETFGFHKRERLLLGRPDVIVDTWSELEAAVEALYSP